MAPHDHSSLAEARQFVRSLRQLEAATAPGSLLPGVLIRLGLGDAYAFLDTPIGPLFVAYNERGISAVLHAEDAAMFEAAFRDRFQRSIHAVDTLPAEMAEALNEQLSGVPRPDLRFDLRQLTEFERAVLLKALEIPRGEVRPYHWVAREIGRPKAVRAVGSALGHNPVPLLIPCHRVVRSDGRIGHYIFGSENKHKLLTVEGADPDLLERLARSGVRYFGDEAEHTFCFPTCGGMHHRADAQKLVPFHSDKEATAAGYRPCQTCRPAIGA
ncbi:MAG TPA: methylated-DNA--[protein]-cysteine S-methyltransferase [Herpetosiphonaceae bacterium]